MIKTSASDLPLISIAMVNQRSPVIILSLKGAGISRPKDLEGKRIGGAPAGAANQLWPAFARANNIDVSKELRCLLARTRNGSDLGSLQLRPTRTRG
jgi:NitT/TauT family transport system substrate-binding protein